MSLPVDRISEWVNNKALPGEYPVHEVAQGNDWEYIDIPYGKKIVFISVY